EPPAGPGAGTMLWRPDVVGVLLDRVGRFGRPPGSTVGTVGTDTGGGVDVPCSSALRVLPSDSTSPGTSPGVVVVGPGAGVDTVPPPSGGRCNGPSWRPPAGVVVVVVVGAGGLPEAAAAGPAKATSAPRAASANVAAFRRLSPACAPMIAVAS